MALQHLRSATADKRPDPAAMAAGQLAVNTADASPGLFFKNATGTLVKVGPVHVGTTAPNATPASGGTAGNSVGEQWLDTSGTNPVFKIWDGSNWASEAGEFVNASGDTMTGALVMDNQQQVRFRETTANGTNFIAIQAPASVAADRTLTLPDVTGTLVSTGDTGTVTSTMILDGTIVNADISASAAIADTKLATISTAGKVSNSATTATSANNNSAIVARDASGNFSAGTITANLTGNVTGNLTGTASAIADNTVTSAKIVDGTIVNADISATAEIAVSKLADGDARQLLQTDAAGTGVEWASNIDIPGTLDVTGAATFDSSVTVQGDLTINGTTTTIDTTNLAVKDKNIEIGKVATPSNTTADGGGITLKGATDKTLSWVNSTGSWTSSENLDLASGKTYKINGTDVISATALGSAVQISSNNIPNGTVTNDDLAGSIADSKLNTISTANKVSLAALDIDGGTDIGAAIVDADLFIVDDGGTGTNRKAAATRISDYTFNKVSGDVTIASNGTAAIGTGVIVNADINASAAIAHSKLATLSSGNILLGNASNVATSTAVTGDVTISNTGVTAIGSGVIVNADINASAAIVDTKLATIATAGKVANSATTASTTNTASAIVARDSSGNFAAGTITATLAGNASTATAWATGRTIALTGDLTGTSGVFDGTANLSVATTLANSGVTAGTYTKLTVDAKGRATSGTTLAASDIPTLTAAKISDFDTQVRTNRLDQLAAPTAAVSLNNQKITSLATPTASGDAATKAYVDGILSANDAMVFKGTLGTGGTYTALPTTHGVGWTIRVITAGTYAGQVAEVGDMYVSLVSRSGSDNTNADWTLLQTNIDGAVVGPVSATDNHIALFNGTSGKLIKSAGAALGAGTLTVNTSGTGLSGSGTFGANQGTNATITITSNATSANTASAIVARNASGNFSAGTITAALTGAASSNVLKAGDTMTGALLHPLGTAAAPSIAFTGDTNTGIYSPSADQVAVATNGVQRLTTDTAAVTSTLPVVHPLGAVGTPSITFTGDLNTGFWSPTADTLAASTAGSERLRITSAGLVGIGTSSPNVPLEVVGNIHMSGAANRTIFNRANNALSLGTNNTTRLHITNAGNVGIGTTSPGSALEINAAAATSPFIAKINTAEAARIDSSGRLLVGTSVSRVVGVGNSQIQVEGTTVGNSSLSLATNSANTNAARITFGKSRGSTIGSTDAVLPGDQLALLEFNGADGTDLNNPAASISSLAEGTIADNSVPGRLVFSTTADGASSPTERMRIKSNGVVFVNTTSPGVEAQLSVERDGFASYFGCTGTGGGQIAGIFERKVDNGVVVEFKRSTSVVGSISVTTIATAYNTSSDYRLKENVVDLDGAIDRLKLLPVHRFNFIADPDSVVDGFIAHEAAKVVPECVTGEKDAVDDGGNPVYQGIDQSKLVPLLTAALQEAIGEIESLKARVVALESA